MKIDDTLINQAIENLAGASAAGAAKGAKKVPDGEDFASLLLSEVESAGQTGGQDSAVCGPASTSGLLGAQALGLDSRQASGNSEAVSSLSSMLDGLDSLQNALQGTKSAKEINSLIDQVTEQASGLDDKMSGLAADSRLRSLAEEAKVTAYMESVKWRRGDYL